jgi:hypothetical protein
VAEVATTAIDFVIAGVATAATMFERQTQFRVQSTSPLLINGLPWNQLPCVDQYPIDQVARIPAMEDVYLPVDDQIEGEMQ